MIQTIDVGLLVLRLGAGVFFAVTGFRKLFIAEVHAKVSGLLAEHKVPPALQWVTMAGEFLGGLGLIFGALAHIAAAGLVPIMVGAFWMGAWDGVVGKQAASFEPPLSEHGYVTHHLHYRTAMDWSRCNWPQLISNALCTAEAQLLVIVLALAFTGPGAISFDALFG